MIRLIIVILLFLIYIVCFLPVLAVLALIKIIRPGAELKPTFVLLKAFLCVELFASGVTVEGDGMENIPSGPVLFVGNHRSYYDILCTYCLMKAPVGFVAKKQINRIPILNWWMNVMGCVLLDRDNVREGLKSINEAAEHVRHGESMFIFPEGGRNRSADTDIPENFKEGSLKIAQKAGCPIVPVSIMGTDEIYEKHRPFIRAARVRVTFLKPFDYKNLPEEYRKRPAEYARELILEQNLKVKAGH